MARGQMADKPSEEFSSHQLLWSDDDEYEKLVQVLDMRGLLDMVTSLQSAMAKEQRCFDDLSAQLQKYPDPNSPEHQTASHSLCASQMRLARLCTRNMRCFTQQAVRAKKEQWHPPTNNVASGLSIITTDDMASSALQNGSGEKSSSCFRDNLRFFQNQVNTPRPGFRPAEDDDYGIKSKPKTPNSRTNNSVPSVDNILSHVKNIRASQNDANIPQDEFLSDIFQVQRTMATDTREWPSNRENYGRTVVCDTRIPSISKLSTTNSRAENETKNISTIKVHTFSGREHVPKILDEFGSTTSSKYEIQNQHDRTFSGSVSSGNDYRYNPKSGFTKTTSSYEEYADSRAKVNASYKTLFSDKEVNSNLRHFSKTSCYELGRGIRENGGKGTKVVAGSSQGDNSLCSAMTISDSKTATALQSPVTPTAVHNSLTETTSNRDSKEDSNRASNELKPQVQESHLRANISSKVLDSKQPRVLSNNDEHASSDGQSGNLSNSCRSTAGEQTRPRDGGRDLCEDDHEKHSDSFESDLDSKDFVVHKTSFSEDYLEAMSEDAYSSMNDEYEIEHPDGNTHEPSIPSPDYESDEEFQVHHIDGVSVTYDEDGDEEFLDNSAQCVNDPRRYVYYQDDKELEVIPEEDEDDIDDDDDEYDASEHFNRDCCSRGYSDQDKDDICFPLPDEKSPSGLLSHQQQAECDSGVTDDQRSTSSIAEDCELDEDDTDSAKGGSLLQVDSSSESPTHQEHRLSPPLRDKSPQIPQNPEITNIEPMDTKQSMGSKKMAVVSPGILSDRKGLNFYARHYCDGKGTWVDNGDIDAMRQPRNTTGSWDPTDLLKELYRLDYPDEPNLFDKSGYINMEGYLEKLPSGRRKATYWNPWKKRYFRLRDGFLHCHDGQNSEKATTSLQLMGGSIDTLENNMIGIDDKKGHYIVVRCMNIEESEFWVTALLTHCSEDFTSAYIQPIRYPLPLYKDTIIIDLGSSSVRAGILMENPTLPQLFFPTVCATEKISGRKVYGSEALRPDVRKNSHVTFPVLPSAKVTKYTMDVTALPGLLKKVFVELNVDPKKYKVQVSIPRSFSLQTQIKVVKILLEEFGVRAINLTHQAILSLYAYNASSGIVVDIGDRMDILPINDGYIVEGGVSRLPYGGLRIIHHLKHALAQKHVSLVSDIESYIARHVLEQLCYIAEDYKEEMHRFHMDPDSLEMSISASHLFQGECPCEEIILDSGRFQVPEGLFTPELWGLDNPGVHKLVYRAIQECSVDVRTEMCRSIYVSGGVTLLPGFVSRLQRELDKLTPAKVIPKVHCSPHRYHMAYLGACRLATSEGFKEVCVTNDEWRRHGNACLQKWHL